MEHPQSFMRSHPGYATKSLWVTTGGFALGIGIGVIVVHLLRLVDDHLIEITVTVSVAYGLRGALSIALVLSLPTILPQRGLLDSIVYGIVLITLLEQGIGLRILLPRWEQKES